MVAMHNGVIWAYYSLNESLFCNTSAFHYAFYHIIFEHECSDVYLKSHQIHVIEIALLFNLCDEVEVWEQSSSVIFRCIKSFNTVADSVDFRKKKVKCLYPSACYKHI